MQKWVLLLAAFSALPVAAKPFRCVFLYKGGPVSEREIDATTDKQAVMKATLQDLALTDDGNVVFKIEFENQRPNFHGWMQIVEGVDCKPIRTQ